jgi:hypothetical protein
LIFPGAQPGQGGALPFRVTVEYPKAPQCEAFAEKSKAVIEEWYPKINEILFGPDHPPPADSITLVCEPAKFIAYSDIRPKNRIHISASFVQNNPEEYGTVVHELTHIVQQYAKLKREEVWLQEGIADYVRHQYFEKDIEGLAAKVDPDRDSFRMGYTKAAAFLAWLQKHKNPAVIRELNRGCAEGHCNVELFRSCCGEDVDTLWKEFTDDLRQKSSQHPAFSPGRSAHRVIGSSDDRITGSPLTCHSERSEESAFWVGLDTHSRFLAPERRSE